MEHNPPKKDLLFLELSEPLNEPDYNRQATILKEQIFTLVNGRIDPLCRRQITAWQTVFLGLSRHLSSVVQEVNAGQLRCALELDLLLWRVTDSLRRYAGPMASSYALLAREQAAWLMDLDKALGAASSQSRARLEPHLQAIQAQAAWPDQDPMNRLMAGDLRLAPSLCVLDGKLVLGTDMDSQPVLPETNPLLYAQLLLLLRRDELLVQHLLEFPRLILVLEDELALFAPDRRRQLLMVGLRTQADRAKDLVQFAHVFNLLLSLYPDAPEETRLLTAELRRRTGRSALEKLLDRLLAYFQEQTLSHSI